MSAPRAWLAWMLAVLVLLLAAPAAADGTADEAELHFQIAAELYQKGEFRGALEHFMVSQRLVPNRNVVFNIARTFEQMRRYADAHRYYVDALEGETDQKTIADIQAALARIGGRVAVLKVTTTPPGATVYIDRKELGSRGLSPRPLGLPEGKYRVIASLEGYEDAQSEIVDARLGAEVPVKLELRRIVGKVKIDVEGAPSVTVHVDDERGPAVCTAPCVADVPPGPHLLYFSHEGFQGAPRQVVVSTAAPARTVARMTPLVGSLAVTADERDATVEIDGKPSGFTPAVIPNVAVGTRKVRVVLRGFAPIERVVVIKPNQQSELLDLRLVPVRTVVAVSRLTDEIDDAPSSLTVIDGQELRAFGYPHIAEALRGVRGVTISNDRAYYSANIRGLGEPNDYGNRLLVLSDGASLNDNLVNSSYIGPDGRVDLHDVDRIEVVRGPGSLLYGTGAFSGVVNLVTRPTDEPDGVHAAIGTYDNSVARGRAGFHLNFTKNSGMWASVSGARSSGHDVQLERVDLGPTPRTATAHDVDQFDSVGTAGRVWAGPLSAQWFFHRRDQHIPVGPFGTQFDNPNTVWTDERAMGEVRYEPKLGRGVQLLTRIHADHYHFGGVYKYPPEPPATNASTNLEDYYGTWGGLEARLVFTPSNAVRLTVGGEGQHNPQADLLGGVPDSDGELHVERCEKSRPTAADQAYCAGTYLDVRDQYSFGAVYALGEIEPAKWVRITSGVRVDVYSTFGAIVVPRSAVIFKPTTGGVLKVMGGRAFRAPSVYEQLYSDGGFTQVQAVDKNQHTTLGPESIVTGEVEYSQRFARDWVALGAVHASHVSNIINSITVACTGPFATPGTDCIRYANSNDPVLLAGGDLELRREWRQGWMVSAYYSYQRAQYLNYHPGPASAEDPNDPRLINSPEHLASAKGVVPLLQDVLSLGLRATLESPRRITLVDRNLAPSEQTTPTAVIADATFSGRARRFGVTYVVGVYNLFDWRYEVPVADTFASRTMPQNGRTFLLDLMVQVP